MVSGVSSLLLADGVVPLDSSTLFRKPSVKQLG